MKFRLALLLAVVLGIGAAACGVKGPPLPPVADTPQSSDSPAMTGGAPTPITVVSPSPSPTPKTKTKTKAKKHR